MSTEYRVVPVEPTEEMYFAFCEARGAKGSTFKEGLRAAILAAPVPPAGGEPDEIIDELKMMADMCSDNEDPEDQLMYMRWIARIRRGDAEVTRLQAELKQLHNTSVKLEVFEIVCNERDALKAEVDRLKLTLETMTEDRDVEKGMKALARIQRDLQCDLAQKRQSELTNERSDTVKRLEWAKEAAARIDILESELTKAREFDPCNWTDRQVLDFLGIALRNVDVVGKVYMSEIRQGFEHMRARQSAPAAKEVRLLSVADDMSTCTLSNGDGQGYFYDRIEDDKS